MELDPPPDLVEIAEALDAMAKPHYGSACKLIAESEGEQCTTEGRKRSGKSTGMENWADVVQGR